MSSTIRIYIIGFAIVLLQVPLFAEQASKSPATTGSWQPVMKELANSFRTLQKIEKSGRMDEVAAAAKQLLKSADVLRDRAKSSEIGRKEEFNAHITELTRVVELLARGAARKDLRALSTRIEQLRHTCVSCHTEVQSVDSSDSLYPARRSTLLVNVKVSAIDKTLKADHSNVVVFLDGKTSGSPPYAHRIEPIISQINQRFQPRILPIVKGTTVAFPNDDEILHNVFSLSKPRAFDLDVYQPGKTKTVTFQNPGLVKLYCNIHPNMSCSILVLNNPYFGVSNRKGVCVITDVPDGEYTLRSWNALGAESQKKIVISENSVSRAEFKIVETRRSGKHKNKFGQSYRGKYE